MSNKVTQPELQGVAIVALGSFNPAILHPLWFSSHGLLPAEEAENAKVNVVHKEIAIFSTDWFALQALGDRFTIETEDPTKYLSLRDLAVGTFRVLEHTPVRAFGLNRHQTFAVGSEEQWRKFGDHYAPTESWNDLLVRPGMRTLIVEGKRRDGQCDRIQIKIEPSQKLPDSVFIKVNEHYGPRGAEDQPENRLLDFIKVLHSGWDDFLAYSDKVGQHLLSEYSKEGR